MREPALVARALACVALTSLLSPAPAPAAAAATGGARLSAEIDDVSISGSTEARPIRLAPRRPVALSVEVTNSTSKPLDIRIVRLEGKVVGLTFFAYDTAVGLKVAPGETGSRRFMLDLAGLDGQATGLIPGAVKLLDADRRVVAEEGGVVDVRGSLRSVYGVFGVGVAFLTVLSFLGALVGLARHRLPPNRWRRALRFLTPGLGLGLLLNFTLSATRVFVPTPGRWLTIVVVSAAVLFGLGYLTPAPDTDEDTDDDDKLVALPAAPVALELPAPVAAALPSPEVAVELPSPEAPRELAASASASAPDLATPDGMAALPAAPDLAPPDAMPELPSAPAPPGDDNRGASGHRAAPATVAEPTSQSVDP